MGGLDDPYYIQEDFYDNIVEIEDVSYSLPRVLSAGVGSTSRAKQVKRD